MGDFERVPTLTKEQKKKRKGNRILKGLGWVFLVGLCILIFFRSPLSKVDEVKVTGNGMIETDHVIGLSKVAKGDSFFSVRPSEIEEELKKLPEVKEVRVTREFPGKVLIELFEYRHVAFYMESHTKIIPVLENGTRLENRVWDDRVIDKPILREWKDHALLTKLCEELMKVEPLVLHAISEIEPAPVEDPQRLILYMKDGYEVHTSIRHFAKNMSWYPSFVANLKQEGKDKGMIMLLDGKWFIPYENVDGKSGGN